MKKSNLRRLALAAVAAACVAGGWGCASVERSMAFSDRWFGETPPPMETVVVENWGVYLFNKWPIICGDPTDVGSPVFFRDTVNLENNCRLVDAEMKRVGASVPMDYKTELDEVGSTGFWIFWKRVLVTSATVYDGARPMGK